MGGTRCSLVLGSKEGSEGGCWLQVRTTRGGAALPEPSQSSAPCTTPAGSHAARRSGAFARSGTQSALAHRALRAVLSSEGLQEKKKKLPSPAGLNPPGENISPATVIFSKPPFHALPFFSFITSPGDSDIEAC